MKKIYVLYFFEISFSLVFECKNSTIVQLLIVPPIIIKSDKKYTGIPY